MLTVVMMRLPSARALSDEKSSHPDGIPLTIVGAMSITVTCHCGKKLQSRDEHAGMRAKCPACGAVLLIPQPAVKVQPTVKAEPATAPLTTNPHTPTPPPGPLYEGKRV